MFNLKSGEAPHKKIFPDRQGNKGNHACPTISQINSVGYRLPLLKHFHNSPQTLGLWAFSQKGSHSKLVEFCRDSPPSAISFLGWPLTHKRKRQSIFEFWPRCHRCRKSF